MLELKKDFEKEGITDFVNQLIDLIAVRKYSELEAMFDSLGSFTNGDIGRIIDEFLKLNDLSGVDKYSVVCSFKPATYDYQQLVIESDGENGYSVDYSLTTNGELNDLTLLLSFAKQQADSYFVDFNMDVQ